ncbi:hypothetical protein GCK32_010050 [Trichostrongylus colubriformis]|uniref:CCHC-type domain-containing protein n=1 Tax=Trichostrongylus colubriformis TaxID=6319 RepID=A0AAN8ICZ6_TRICO
MTTSLSSRQGLLTRSVNRLAAVVDEHRDLETWALEPPSEDHERRTYLRAERLRIRKVKAILDTETSNVDTALERYSTAADSLDADTPSLNEILEKVSSNIERASATLDEGRVVQTAVARLLGELDEIEKSSTTGGTASSPDLPQLKLAPIPIPKFSGRVWEWDTFWTAFEHSVDSREMDDIYKMNYLLDALHGEAKDTIKQYEVSGRTYPLVVARLKEKYGNSRILIDQLIRRLQQARAHSNRLEHQEKLWEELSSIVAQLQLKGENVDNSFLQNQLLGKFAEGVQRHVLRMKENQTTDVTWNTNTLLDCARNYISTELQIVNQMGNKHDQQLDRNSIAVKKNTFTGKRINSALERLNPCFYCGKVDHNPKDCREVATREQRLTFMRKKNLCLNCGAKDHWAVQCKGGSCRMCRQRGHHTSLCEQLPSRKTTVFQETRKPLPAANKGTSKRPMQKSATSPKVNVVLSEADKSQDEVSAFVNIHRGSNDVHILVGEAQDLKLIELSINTFGSNQPLKQTCGITQLQLWDKSGTSHRIEVTKIDTVTEPMDSPDQSSSYDGDVRQHDRSSNETEEQKEEAPRYDLRPRKHMNYYEVTTQGSQIYSANTKRVPLKFFITCLTIFMLMQQAAATLAQGKMQCISGGVMITTQNIERYELCAEGHCHVSEHPQGNETILLPPEVLLHEHHVQLKLFDGYNLTVLETTCLPVSFCEHVRCWFCTANMFNPECSPRTAIASTAVTLYIVIALLYVLCYVPMVVGKPCRIICKTAWIVFTAIARLLWNQCNKFRRNRRRRYDVEALLKAPLLAIACIAVFAPSTLACQDIDVFSHQHSVCSFSPNGYKRCMLETTIIAKLNSFNKEACIRLINKQTVEKELRIQWKHLRLNCVKDNIVFTRNTIQRVVDSKRCPHSGSCTNDKCASVNTSAHIAELEHGNRYPGLTFCVESCGGPGCGCFYLSSGCLFYRIFHIPTDSKIYEIFKCPQWQEEVELEITTVSRQKSVEKKVVVVHPTVPTNTDNMRITLSALAVPPTPALSSTFISDGSHLATWNHKDKPHLQCGSEMDARSLNCSVTTSCNCEPAENKINCLCVDANITEIFTRDIETRFPIHRPWITFTPSKTNRASVTAEIPSFTTAEFVIHLTDHVDKTVTMVTDSVCTIPNSIAQGCYNCPQGATAQVTCTTDGNDTMATVQCGDLFFTIPCNRKGAISTLRFSHASARVKKECKVSCGKSETIFEITGILQWIRTIHGSTLKILAGESSVYDELVFPDFGHIIDVFLSWYKTLLIACVVLILASVIGYVFLWSCGINIIQRVLRVSWIIVRKIVKIPLWMLKTAWRSAAFIPRQSTKGSEKLL